MRQHYQWQVLRGLAARQGEVCGYFQAIAGGVGDAAHLQRLAQPVVYRAEDIRVMRIEVHQRIDQAVLGTLDTYDHLAKSCGRRLIRHVLARKSLQNCFPRSLH